MALDPVTAIADAIGSIVNVFGTFKNAKTEKELLVLGNHSYYNPFSKSVEKDNTFIISMSIIGFLIAISIVVLISKR